MPDSKIVYVISPRASPWVSFLSKRKANRGEKTIFHLMRAGRVMLREKKSISPFYPPLSLAPPSPPPLEEKSMKIQRHLLFQTHY